MIEYIVGGFLLVLFLLIVWFMPRRLTNLSIDIAERIKPGMWYSRSIEKNVRDRDQIFLIWIAFIFVIGMWCFMLYVYPYLMSLIKG